MPNTRKRKIVRMFFYTVEGFIPLPVLTNNWVEIESGAYTSATPLDKIQQEIIDQCDNKRWFYSSYRVRFAEVRELR